MASLLTLVVAAGALWINLRTGDYFLATLDVLIVVAMVFLLLDGRRSGSSQD